MIQCKGNTFWQVHVVGEGVGMLAETGSWGSLNSIIIYMFRLTLHRTLDT